MRLRQPYIVPAENEVTLVDHTRINNVNVQQRLGIWQANMF